MPDNPSTWERVAEWIVPIVFAVGSALGVGAATGKTRKKEFNEVKQRVASIERLLAQGTDHERRIAHLEKDPIDRIMTERDHQIICRANTTDTLLEIKRVVDESLKNFKSDIRDHIGDEIRLVYSIIREEDRK